jgi:type IV pilus assembly protein PilW
MTAIRSRSRQEGFSIIEIMVGVVIGMIAVLVIYQVFATSEAFRRNITAAGDAQQNGLLSSFMMGIELANAGNGLAVAGRALGACAPTVVAGAAPTFLEIANSQLPIPLLITDGGGANSPDSFVIYYSVARTLLTPATFSDNAAANSSYSVFSANGFKNGDMIVAISNPTAAFPSTLACYTSVITAAPVSSAFIDNTVAPPESKSVLTLTHTGAPVGMTANASTLFNLGPANLIQKVRYDVSGGNLRSTAMLDPATGAPDDTQPVNPLASNVVNVKVQYGIDTVGDGLIHHWVPAVAGTAYGDWDAKTVLTAKAYPDINRIKAARIAILVKSEQHDKELNPDPGFSRTVFNDCADGGTCYPVTFSIPPVVGQPYGWRYRIYEAVIPLRNETWNK